MLKMLKQHIKFYTSLILVVFAFLGFRLLSQGEISIDLIYSWDIGMSLYLFWTFWTIRQQHRHREKMTALLQERQTGTKAMFAIVSIIIVACLVALVRLVSIVQNLPVMEKMWYISVAIISIFLSWLVIHILFAIRYAHLFYHSKISGEPMPLQIPQSDGQNGYQTEPNYYDFIYTALIIGTSAQTADVMFSSRAGRILGGIHSIVAFIFNVTVLSLLINIISGFI
ncbi:DUF1345 domain-containing protein [Avibacterium sp. 20-129]|uniref:DUF1345 domain-containing protein n=1 Tax=Avibacterium sp. 20-129 TaxID=2911525 RepID=UPI002247C4FA|nr:DUF1345 domain-containing protein [Avibacterium sp. 20-129]MCW9699942.1 DUF1345 domain-containing protein [Avibacterium sp. 20-129]